MRSILTSLLFLSGFLAADAASADNLTASGRVKCWQGGTNYLPLAHVTVQMWDANYHDTFMGTTFTDDDGFFTIAGTNGDNYPNRPDPYIRVIYTDQAWRAIQGDGQRLSVTDEWGQVMKQDESHNAHNETPAGTANLGDIIVGHAGSTADCALFRDALAAHEEFRSITGEHPPAGATQVMRMTGVWTGVPYAFHTTIKWPSNYPVDASTMRHEFAHTVRHGADGDVDHWNEDDAAYIYARVHDTCTQANDGYAFNEGWAEFWSDEPACWAPDPTNPNLLGAHRGVEGDVAQMLRDMASCAGGKLGMYRILRDNPRTIHSIGAFFARFQLTYPLCAQVYPWQRVGGGMDASTDPTMGRGLGADRFVFYMGSDGGLWGMRQDGNGIWSAPSSWASPMLTIAPVAMGRGGGGAAQVFVVADTGQIWTTRQTQTGWTAWQSLGGWFQDVTVGTNQDGRLELFSRGTDGKLWQSWQGWVDGPFSGWWLMRDEAMKTRAAVALASDGKQHVFAVGADGAIWEVAQSVPNGGWGAWTSLGGGPFNSVTAIRDTWGNLQQFATSPNGFISRRSYGGMSNWTTIGLGAASPLEVTFKADGNYDVLTRTRNLSEISRKDQNAQGGIGGWVRRGLPGRGRPAAGLGSDGRMWIFARDLGNRLRVQHDP